MQSIELLSETGPMQTDDAPDSTVHIHYGMEVETADGNRGVDTSYQQLRLYRRQHTLVDDIMGTRKSNEMMQIIPLDEESYWAYHDIGNQALAAIAWSDPLH